MLVGLLLVTSSTGFMASRPPLPHRQPAPKLASEKALRIRGGEGSMSLADAFGLYAPAAGILTSNALYFSALPEVLRARTSGSLGAFNPLPSTIMVLSVLLWLCYGLSVKNPWIVASNLPGAAAVLLTFVVMLPLMGKDHEALTSCQATLVGGTMLTLCMFTGLIFSGATAAVSAQFIGYLASACFVCLAASPLSTIRTVISSRNSASIYLPLTLAQCANTLLWTIYGAFAAKDLFVYGPNGVGLALGVTQLALKALFPSKE